MIMMGRMRSITAADTTSAELVVTETSIKLNSRLSVVCQLYLSLVHTRDHAKTFK